MGEVIVSLVIGGTLILSGIGMNLYLRREEERLCGDKEDEQ